MVKHIDATDNPLVLGRTIRRNGASPDHSPRFAVRPFAGSAPARKLHASAAVLLNLTVLVALQPPERALAQTPPPCLDSAGNFVAEEIDGCGGYGGGATPGNTPSTGGASNPLGSGANGSAAAVTTGGSGGGGGGGAGTIGGAGGAGGATSTGANNGVPGGTAGANGSGGNTNGGGSGGGGGSHGVFPSSPVNPAGTQIAGSPGGNGGNGGPPAGTASIGGGGGGAGGYGLVVNTAVDFVNHGSIVGGQGGLGGNGGATATGTIQGSAGEGGDGGFGVFVNLNAAGVSLTNTGTISGGNGGNSGNGNFTEGGNGGAGIRAVGVNASPVNPVSIENSGTIRGGNGGVASPPIGGAITIGGNGGAGINGSNLTILNDSGGQIIGGNGGTSSGTSKSSGGAGIIGDNLTVYNSGNITGGLTGGGVQVNAITFTGGTNYLELRQGYSIVGNVVVQPGASGTLALGGDGNGSFDVSSLGPAVQYQGFGQFVKTGASTWTLTGTPPQGNTPWTLLGGELSVADGASLGTPSASGLTFNGGILQVTGTAYTGTEAERSITWGVNGGGFDIVDGAHVFTVSQNLENGGRLAKLGPGTLVLSGNNSYVGDTLLEDGTLSVGSNSALGNASQSVLRMANGTTLSFTNGDFTVGNAIAITGTGNFTPPTGSVQTLSGTIADGSTAGTLAMRGPGTLVLAADNSYTGGTTIDAGTLQLGNGGTTGSIVGDVANNGTLAFDRSNDLPFSGAITGTGSVAQIGTGRTILTASNTYTGGTTISAGTLQLGNGGTTGSIVGDVTNNGTLAFDRSNVLAFDGTISGTGGVAQIGTGTTVLSANSPYSGGTLVGAGTLVVGDPQHGGAALSGGGPLAVAAGATLGGYGSVSGDVTNDGIVAAGNATPGYDSAAAGTFTINGNLLNRANVNLASDPIVGNVLRVSGNYTSGPAATATINTLLNAGGPLTNQLTDRLLVGGDASGTTLVTVKPLAESPGGPTAPTGIINASEGISIVQVAGNSTQHAFALPGGYVVAPSSPFEYQLYAYGPGSTHGSADASQSLVGNAGNHWDYRLQNAYVTPGGGFDPQEGDLGEGPGEGPGEAPGEGAEPELSIPNNARPEVAPQVPAYLSAPAALLYAGLMDIDSLHRRLGEIRDDGDLNRDGGPGEMFLRVYGGHFDYSSNVSFHNFGYDSSGDYTAIQFGANAFRSRTDKGLWRFGLAGSAGWLHFEPNAVDGPSSSRSNVYRLSGYGTYQSRQGWYVDGILSAGWFNGTINTQARGQALKLQGNAYAASIEAGYPFALPRQINIEPQLQLIGQHLSFHNAVDVDGLAVNIGSQNQLTGRLGVRVTRPFEVASGRVTPYAGIDVLHAFANGTNVQVGEASFTSGKMGDAVQFSVGVNGTTSPRLSLYGRVSYLQPFGSAGYRAWLLNAGARYLF